MYSLFGGGHDMEKFINELITYMNESEARGNKVISIHGVRAMLERHQTHKKAPTSRFPTTEEYLHVRELERSIAASRGLKMH
jgi:hypothetical protein